MSQVESMGNAVLNDVENIGGSVYNDVTHFFGNIWHHDSTATSSLESTSIPSTSTAITITSISSIPATTTPMFGSLTSSSSIPSSTSISSSFVSSATSDTAITTTTATTASSQRVSRPPGGVKLLFLVFLLGALTMLALVLLAPIVVRACKFSVNFFNIFFDKSGGTFTRDSELGLTSEAFALQDNIDRDDRRNGLDKKAKLRILWYMFYYEEDFDEARLRYVKYQFLLNGIGEDGQPLDPKYISYD